MRTIIFLIIHFPQRRIQWEAPGGGFNALRISLPSVRVRAIAERENNRAAENRRGVFGEMWEK